MQRTYKRQRAAIGAAALAAATAVASVMLINQQAGADEEDPADAVPAQECGGESNAVVDGSGGSYTTTNGGSEVYSGGDYLAAIQAGIDSLNPDRTEQESVVVNADGAIGGNHIGLPSHTSLSVCGTMDVGSSSGHGAIEAGGAQDVSIPHLNMTGNPYFGLRFFGMDGLHLGQINMELSGGLGIRFERDEAGSTDVSMDDVFVSGAGSHAVETWNIDGLEIGSVTARDVGESGLLLQTTTNAHVGTVDGENVATGTGYATFRMANENGSQNGDYSTNVQIDNVISRGGGRGIFCVSQSGGVNITNIDLADNGNNSILIENCYGVTIEGGTVNGGGEVRLAARDEFANNRDISITAEVNGTSVRESPCGENVSWNISGDASLDVC
ncbi:right-handed parallel beta-helix repeat-containing protein [Glycomyces buryatensis]|uniref:Right-handed parallel beta-helix repeat-containing protein n=1 Tax=Glycomyces buryatensis TaxID=2570927 RepID=A0A4S8Q5C0_9ACTN|nr:right-handed parallel beta-helix repeat-containing protein [Glycomyces buryatensis]THV39487.1 right-handed parallel beta-helix repeat-containing protein [Glycomyces buryatensis]